MAQSDEALTRQAYDVVADVYADHFRSTEPEQAVDLAMIAHFAALVDGVRRVLDAGCGVGRMFQVEDEMERGAMGSEKDPQAVVIARHPEHQEASHAG